MSRECFAWSAAMPVRWRGNYRLRDKSKRLSLFLSILAAAADEQPLLIAVDDAQWLDLPSLEAIVFTARRLEAESMAMVLTARPSEDVPAEVGPATRSAACACGDGPRPGFGPRTPYRAAPRSVPDALAEQWAESAGNPLALLELPSLSEDTVPVEPLRIGWRLERTSGGASRDSVSDAPGDAAGGGSRRLLGRRPKPSTRSAGPAIADLEPAETADCW